MCNIGASVNDKIKSTEPKRKRKKMGDPSSLDGGYLGPWAGFVDEEPGVALPTHEATEEELAAIADATAQVEKATAAVAAPPKTEDTLAAAGERGPETTKERTTFHGREEFDYLGRTYLHVPTDIDGVTLHGDAGRSECYIPKQLVHTWTGHTKGVNAIQFIPKSAHLLLSCSMDTKVKVR